MKQRFTNPLHRRNRKKGDTAQLAAQLAPLEEQEKHTKKGQPGTGHSANAGATQEYGAIVVNNSVGNLSQDIMEGSGERTLMGMEPVVLVILGVMLTFIAFIAWQISKLPVQ